MTVQRAVVGKKKTRVQVARGARQMVAPQLGSMAETHGEGRKYRKNTLKSGAGGGEVKSTINNDEKGNPEPMNE